ncbi:MAG: hypothetical protein C0498_13160 [Anaerolinea sp.]|jgi:hypothetical protein|nr:hypothetical protein [Anaerolinea sp.]
MVIFGRDKLHVLRLWGGGQAAAPALIVLASLLVGGCQARGPETLVQAIANANREISATQAVEVFNSSESGEARVLELAEVDGRESLVLVVLDAAEPSNRLLLLVSDVDRSNPAATIAFTNSDGTLYVFGLVSDLRIVELRLTALDSERAFPVHAPGFVVTATTKKGTSAWEFRDATKTVIASGGGS